jgi:hypothetical protein
MSEYINNREMRQKAIKDIIQQLHDGKSVEEVKQQFEDAFEGVTASEISVAEAALIAEGLPVSEIQRLCDVHASVFKGSIEEIHQPTELKLILGHPMNVLIRENSAIKDIINNEIKPHLSKMEHKKDFKKLVEGIDKLAKINLHYQKKENLLFPYMEKYGITAPPKVMWGVDDEIRNQIKEIKVLLIEDTGDRNKIVKKIEDMLNKVTEMIFKEENIMYPMLVENLTQEEWKSIYKESPEIGFILDKVPEWKQFNQDAKVNLKKIPKPEAKSGMIKLPSGEFKVEELICMLNALPFDITFVNKDGIVKYFSEGKERTFPRTKTIIGREVSNCHPPASVHVVEKIVEGFKLGSKNHEDFWIRMGNKFIFIRYYAVRNEKGEFIGVLEVTQDIKPIQDITGEKRLLSE